MVEQRERNIKFLIEKLLHFLRSMMACWIAMESISLSLTIFLTPGVWIFSFTLSDFDTKYPIG